MTVIDVDITDDTPFRKGWELPAAPDQLRSPIPGGLIIFTGTQAIATLGSGDQTKFTITYVMPTGFAYIIRNHNLRFQSDDATVGFNDLGFASYASQTGGPQMQLKSEGLTLLASAVAGKYYSLLRSAPKLLMTGGQNFLSRLNDVTGAGSVAGDMTWYSEFYVFNADQIDKWEINTPIPTISHTSF